MTTDSSFTPSAGGLLLISLILTSVQIVYLLAGALVCKGGCPALSVGHIVPFAIVVATWFTNWGGGSCSSLSPAAEMVSGVSACAEYLYFGYVFSDPHKHLFKVGVKRFFRLGARCKPTSHFGVVCMNSCGLVLQSQWGGSSPPYGWSGGL